MKNVTISNRQIAMRAGAVVLSLGVIYYAGQNGMINVPSVTETTRDVTPVTLYIPHEARGLYYGGDASCRDTAEHKIYIGMPEAQLECQTGVPEKVNNSTNRYGTRAQFVYDGWYVYTENGIVTSWQEPWTR